MKSNTQDNDNSCAVISAIIICKIREASNIISVFNKVLLLSAGCRTLIRYTERERERKREVKT